MKFKELEGKGLEWKYLTEHGEKDVAVVNLVMNCLVPQKFQKILHQLKNKVIYRHDVLLTYFVSQFVRYNYQLNFLGPNASGISQISWLPSEPNLTLIHSPRHKLTAALCLLHSTSCSNCSYCSCV